MYGLLVTVHVLVSIFLIAVILLQAGRGSGLADTFGGSQMQSLFGTKSATVLAKLTAVCATIFILTSITLAVISSHRTRSLVDRVSLPQAQQQPAAKEAVPANLPAAGKESASSEGGAAPPLNKVEGTATAPDKGGGSNTPTAAPLEETPPAPQPAGSGEGHSNT